MIRPIIKTVRKGESLSTAEEYKRTLDSTKNTLKRHSAEFVTVTLPAKAGVGGGSRGYGVIDHNLGYKPFVRVFVQDPHTGDWNKTPTTIQMEIHPDWVTATSYAIDDQVWSDGALFKCTVAHTSDSTNRPPTGASWTSYWGAGDLLPTVFVATSQGDTETNINVYTFLNDPSSLAYDAFDVDCKYIIYVDPSTDAWDTED